MGAPLFDFDIVLAKAQKYCAYQERCQWEMEKKFRDWWVDKSIVNEVMASLISDGFINEERFALHFASGRFRMKQWGRQKIKLELKKKQVSAYSINKALEAIKEEEYELTLQKLIAKKEQMVQAKNEYEKKHKIAQYLHSKGYESELIWRNLHISENE